MTSKSGRALKIIAIILMAMTAAMNLLGGSGTVCAAFLTKQYPPMWPLLDYQWLYQTLMITTIITGIAGIWATVKLVRGGETAYRNALIILGIGSALGLTQYVASQIIRGAATPANMKFFTNFVTLIVFLLLRLPGLREKVDFSESSNSKGTNGGLAATVAGIIILSAFLWVSPSHTYMGDNWVLVLEMPLLISGSILTVGGLIVFTWSLLSTFRETSTIPTTVQASGD
jgi:hypothetical protein